MAIVDSTNALATGLWPQQDARDPLGVWGARKGVTGDATGGSVKVQINEVVDRIGGLIYTCYSAIAVGLSGAFTDDAWKLRLLTGWPDIDELAGVQGYGSAVDGLLDFNANFTAPTYVPNIQGLVQNQDRFLLLFDPRQQRVIHTLLEIEVAQNLDLATYSFEAYGYYWDRSVMETPGGPRHPGAQ